MKKDKGKPSETNPLPDAITLTATAADTVLAMPFSLADALRQIERFGGDDLVKGVCSSASKIFGVANFGIIVGDLMAKTYDEDGLTEEERNNVITNTLISGGLAYASFSSLAFFTTPFGLAVVSIITFANLIANLAGTDLLKMAIDYFFDVNEAYCNGHLKLTPQDISQRHINSAIVTAQDILNVNSANSIYSGHIGVGTEMSRRALFRVLEGAFYTNDRG